MYLGDCKDERTKHDLALLIEEFFKQRIVGLPNEQGINVSPTFPKIVYVLEEDNIHENSKYWYLTELAAECSARRLVPDYISEKIMKQLKVDENGEGHCFSPMGCLDYPEKIEIESLGEIEIGEFAEAFVSFLNQTEKVNRFIDSDKNRASLYISNTANYVLNRNDDGTVSLLRECNKEKYVFFKDIEIFKELQWFYIGNSLEIILPENLFKIKSNNEFVNLNSVMINIGISNWIRVFYNHNDGEAGNFLATTDHPLPVNEGEVVEVKDLKIGDRLITTNNTVARVTKLAPVRGTRNSYDVSTETEYFNINKKILSHNCRSFLSTYVDGNNKPKYWGRANLGVCTLNLAHIALSAKGNIDDFWRILDERAKLVLKTHLSRVKHLEKATSDVAPILWQHGAIARLKKGEPISNLFYNGYSTISMGYAGLYETVYALIGKSHTTEEGQELAVQIMKKLNKYCDEWKEQTGLGFSLYGTPLESTTGKLANALRRDFGEIEGITNHEYVTNSYHISVREDIDAFSKLDKESVFQALSPGGAISYVEVPDMTKNIPAVLEVIKHIYNTIMYAELNTRSDLCMECGYDGEITQKRTAFGEFVWECPNCGNRDMDKMSIVRRTCGYLSNVKNGVSSGRQGDYADRVFHL